MSSPSRSPKCFICSACAAAIAGKLLLHRLRLLRKRRAEFCARRLRGGGLLGARIGEVLPQVALEVGIRGGEHLEPRAHVRSLARRGVTRGSKGAEADEHDHHQSRDDDERGNGEQRQDIRHGASSLAG